MLSSQVYIAVGIIALLAIFIVLVLRGKAAPSSRISPLTGVALAFTLGGLLLGDDPRVGFSLLGIGVGLAVIDAVRRARQR